MYIMYTHIHMYTAITTEGVHRTTYRTKNPEEDTRLATLLRVIIKLLLLLLLLSLSTYHQYKHLHY